MLIKIINDPADFKHYDDPRRAHKIADEYFSEQIDVKEDIITPIAKIIRYNNMAKIIRCNDKCDGLDYALDQFLSKDTNLLVSEENPTDEDSDDFNDAAIKFYEELTVHNPLLVS
jgi:hypothetical protein